LAYQVINIGRRFSDKSRQQLVENLDAHEQNGWELHSVFAVSESTGCLGSSTVETLYMVLKSK
jgi:hypothetical protein